MHTSQRSSTEPESAQFALVGVWLAQHDREAFESSRACGGLMLLTGVIVISVWAAANLLMGLVVLVNVLFVTPHPLISRIVFTEDELAQLTPKTTATIRSLAILQNASVVAGAVLVLVVAWIGLMHGEYWAWWTLVGTLTFLQAMQFAGDAAIDTKTLPASVFMTLLAVVGLVFAALGLW
jgi:hypothetical protein